MTHILEIAPGKSPIPKSLSFEIATFDAVQLRNQFNGLKTLIDEVPAGPPGPQGPTGPQGPQGPRGEVINEQLNDGLNAAISTAMANSSANTNGISTLSITRQRSAHPGRRAGRDGQAQ